MSNFQFVEREKFFLRSLETRMAEQNNELFLEIRDEQNPNFKRMDPATAYMAQNGYLLAGDLIAEAEDLTKEDLSNQPVDFQFMRYGGGLGVADIRVGFRHAFTWDLRYCPIQVTGVLAFGKRVISVIFPSVSDPADPERKNPHFDRRLYF